MYCPKCNQSFEDGSRRFCPTDGSRLVSDAIQEQSGTQGGVFSSLLPRMSDLNKFDETPAGSNLIHATNEPPDFAPQEQAFEPISKEELFFAFEDQSTEPIFDSLAPNADLAPNPEPLVPQHFAPEQPVSPSEAYQQAPRKIDPSVIPPGHIDLDDAERSKAFSLNFDVTDPDAIVGRIVKGRYKVMSFIAGDDLGLLYLAEDKIENEHKVTVRIELNEDRDPILNSIVAEEKIALSHFRHPNVARLVDSGQFSNGYKFIICEYFDGLSVRDLLTIHGKFDHKRTAEIIRQAAAALSEAHQEGILHRDVRPENLVLEQLEGRGEQVKVISFGSSTGKPNEDNAPYKASEILSGRIPTVASDIFSLAVVGFEMITGRVPFTGTTFKEMLRSRSDGWDLGQASNRMDVPHAAALVFDRAFTSTPTNRYHKARDFGENLYNALLQVASVQKISEPVSEQIPKQPDVIETLEEAKPHIPAAVPIEPQMQVKAPSAASSPEIKQPPAWTRRSPEPPQVESSSKKTLAIVGIVLLIGILAAGWYFLVNSPVGVDIPRDSRADQLGSDPSSPTITSAVEVPPLPRNIPQPPNTAYYQNTKQNLKGDLLLNFVGFTLYFPRDWKVNGPQPGANVNSRGKFLDISRETPDGFAKEQMLISYYPSKGTFTEDADKFAGLVNETNETLNQLIPGYQMVSQGEIKVNGNWRAYELKFQGGGESAKGEKLVIWGRRLFIPAASPGVRNGFEITMLATSLSDNVKGVDDVGVKGELASILHTFEPGQNF